MSYLKRAETILFHMSEMHGDETFVSEGYAYYEDCAKAMAEEMVRIRREALDEALDRVFFTRCSIILENDDYTQGHIDACKEINNSLRKLKLASGFEDACNALSDTIQKIKKNKDSEKNSDAMNPWAVSRLTSTEAVKLVLDTHKKLGKDQSNELRRPEIIERLAASLPHVTEEASEQAKKIIDSAFGKKGAYVEYPNLHDGITLALSAKE